MQPTTRSYALNFRKTPISGFLYGIKSVSLFLLLFPISDFWVKCKAVLEVLSDLTPHPLPCSWRGACSPLLPGLLLRGFHGTLQGALEGLQLVQCLFQKKASHKLLQIRSFLIVLRITWKKTQEVRLCLLGWKYTREGSDFIQKGSRLEVSVVIHVNHISNLCSWTERPLNFQV